VVITSTNLQVLPPRDRHQPQAKRVDTKQIGRELRVRYVLEGSVRRLGGHIRVNAQLIDADTDAHLWAERFDGDMSDLFALQNEVTSRIAVALNLELFSAEAARPTESVPTCWIMFCADALHGTSRHRVIGMRKS